MSNFYEYTFKKGIRLNKIKEQLYLEDMSDTEQILLFHGAKTGIDGMLRLDCSKKKNDSDIMDNLIPQLQGTDYIIAPIADNRMFEIIDQFIDGELSFCCRERKLFIISTQK